MGYGSEDVKPLYRFFLVFWGVAGILAVGFEVFLSADISWSFVVPGTCVSVFFIVLGMRREKKAIASTHLRE